MRYPNRVRKRWIALRSGLGRAGGILSEFAPFFVPRRRGLALALAVLLAETASSLAQPWPLALAIDYVIGDKEPPAALPGFLARQDVMLAGVALLVVLVFTATRTASAFRRYLLQRLGQETVFQLREALYAKVHALGLDYHGRRRTGDTITRVTSDVREVRTLLVDSVVEVASSLMVLVGMLAVMLWLDVGLTLLALLTVPFLFAAVVRYRAALIERMRVVRAREGAIASVAQEAITGIRAVKIFGREEEEMGRFREESEESLRASVDSALIAVSYTHLTLPTICSV